MTNKIVISNLDELFYVSEEYIKNNKIPCGTPVIKISKGDEFYLSKKIIQNFIQTLNSETLDKFDIFIKKHGDGYLVKFGELDDDWKFTQ